MPDSVRSMAGADEMRRNELRSHLAGFRAWWTGRDIRGEDSQMDNKS